MSSLAYAGVAQTVPKNLKVVERSQSYSARRSPRQTKSHIGVALALFRTKLLTYIY